MTKIVSYLKNKLKIYSRMKQQYREEVQTYSRCVSKAHALETRIGILFSRRLSVNT